MGLELGFQVFRLEGVLQNKSSHKAEEGLLVLVVGFVGGQTSAFMLPDLGGSKGRDQVRALA